MGLPEEYDWGFTSEALAGFRKDMTVSVGFEIGPRHVEAIALVTNLDVSEVSQHVDMHLERGTE